MTASATRSMRVVRGVAIGALVFNVAEALAFLVAGHFTDVIVLGSVALILAAMICLQTVRIRRREREINRPRPDYAAIAKMEREVWGRTFEHDGAPGMTVAELKASMDDLAERATARMRPCIGCGSSEARVYGKCLDCYGRAMRQRSDGSTPVLPVLQSFVAATSTLIPALEEIAKHKKGSDQ